MSKRKFKHKATTFNKANLTYLAHCANIAYKSKEEIRQELNTLGFDVDGTNFFFENRDKAEGVDTQCFVTGDKDKIIVSFRGSEAKLTDWLTNKRFIKIKWSKDKTFGRVHRGFHKALKGVWPDVREEILRLRTNKQPIWLTGHSLGGALAQLAAATLRFQEKQDWVGGVYTFGQPRAGNSDFAKKYNSHLKNVTCRVVNNNDLVARIPTINYSHAGQLFYFSSKETLHRDKQMSWWEKKLDRLKGRIKGFPNGKTDGIDDHSMDRYQELCEKTSQAKQE
ncbi:MAG: lipase family protein [Candidatus Electrothrix sp. AR5]|nr:lipase family protein [Candidatus Electrothrix sp. AR5]